jgi:hypothetical protein
MSVIDLEGDIWLGPFNLHYFSTLDSFKGRNFLPFTIYNDNQVSSVSFALACWAPFCPHPPTNVPSMHITQTPTICKHRPTRLRPTDPWHTCSYRWPTKQFWFSIRLSTIVGTLFSSQGGAKNWCDVSTFHWQWCQHSNKSHWFCHHIWHPFGLQVPFKCKQIIP